MSLVCLQMLVTDDVYFRGYGESDHPAGRSQYKLSLLVNDVKEIVSRCRHFGSIVLSKPKVGQGSLRKASLRLYRLLLQNPQLCRD